MVKSYLNRTVEGIIHNWLRPGRAVPVLAQRCLCNLSARGISKKSEEGDCKKPEMVFR